ncbi:hypothetical protein DFH08DRAFT_822755 [Mycena albidolilacea]|uniref:Uncharacterized protein n=1 Tax=Mycena albidolilacea TaxID=1033008 RepID=A0AAD6Z7G0_9AGAR|nr:hypothetical protein DFH08DRAFT_822755 [Mycena albidolilacea]
MVDTITKAFSNDAFTAIVTGHRPHKPGIAHARLLCKSTLTAGLLGGDVYGFNPSPFLTGRRTGRRSYPPAPVKTAVTDGTGGTRPSRGPQLPSDGMGIPVLSRKTAVFLTAVPFNGQVEALIPAKIVGKDQKELALQPLLGSLSEDVQRWWDEFLAKVKVYQHLGFELMSKEKAGDLKMYREEFTGLYGDNFFM